METDMTKNAKSPRPAAPNVKRMRAAVEKAMAGGGAERVSAQKSRGKFTARERI